MKGVDAPEWLKGLPLAPEFHPTDTEFADPIAYISKIEKQAGAFGICKVIPPLPKPSKKYVLHNLNKSLFKCPDLGLDVNHGPLSRTASGDKATVDGGEFRGVFTTRHQELGQSEKKKTKGAVGGLPLGAHKQVWQSGEVYTVEQFEAKSKTFARSQLGMVKEVSPLVVEAMFWKAASEEPIYVEYANDVPGSGFGEPEGLFHYFHGRRKRGKRKVIDRNSQGSSAYKNGDIGTLRGNDDGKDSCRPSPIIEIPSTSLSSPSSNKTINSSFSRPKGSSDAGEMEGSAGWKLANSPWNLQVIARSPGSLTRFMPDDIPGVTSPMVYIGMLFSWFAWHVEDHELHSLNFLHMGSPKTWYAVPGDYAYSFEETIRRHAYGENTDRLAALTLLGEKTTLLSPEVVAGSGIPCCRLVQNPGEFVVTFPRAYHVGFSHGFNCGEAANFGTPQWLTVAKEAAVRRAAMNYLPMLSHQQLLYLLTMSFISSVPRSLLPGVRSSRRRDRQKEEREVLVKKAFVEDIVKENNLVNILLQKNPSYNAVLWDVDKLPSSGKESEVHKHVDEDGSSGNYQSENNSSQDLVDKMSLYMESYSDLYLDDDLSCEFQIDSGTLPCIACGILGFPFMALVQPSKKAAKHFFPGDVNIKQPFEALKHVESGACRSDMMEDSNRVDGMERNGGHVLNHDEVYLSAPLIQSAVSHKDQTPHSHHPLHTNNAAVTSKAELEKQWDISSGFLRPRIFCLEHAIQTEELLHSKGGAHVLVICHSDFQKIRAHAAVVAEEIGSTFKYNEISLANASQGHLALIDLAIEDEEHDICAEDWTLKLNINLRNCVKVKKNCPLKILEHGLVLGGLFSDTTLTSNSSSLKWRSKKLRSRRKSNNSAESKPLTSVQIEKDLDSGSKLDRQIARKGNIIIQYSRKKLKSKPCSYTEVTKVSVDPIIVTIEEVSLANVRILKSTLIRDENASTDSSEEMLFASGGNPGQKHEHGMLLVNGIQNENSLALQEADLLVITSSVGEYDEAEAVSCTSEKIALEDKSCDTNSSSCHIGHETKTPEASSDGTEIAHVDSPTCTTISGVQSTANNEDLKENKAAHSMGADSERDYCGEDSEAIVIKSPVPINSAGCCTESPSRSCDEHNEDTVPEQFGSGSEASDCVTLNNSKERVIQVENADQDIAVPDHVTLIGEAPASTGSLEVTRETSSPEHSHSGNENISVRHNKESNVGTCSVIASRPTSKSGGKRRRELDLLIDDGCSVDGFVKSPCEGLRPRARKDISGCRVDSMEALEEKRPRKKKTSSDSSIPNKNKKEERKGDHKCNLEGCRMSFKTKADLQLHKRNRCPIDGCGKKFTSHKYAVVHQRVHDSDRPLKCQWKGCTMTFKWAWARTEHLRVHTGERPYKCKVEGCGLTFRFVSDYSRHRRKTGHYVDASS